VWPAAVAARHAGVSTSRVQAAAVVVAEGDSRPLLAVPADGAAAAAVAAPTQQVAVGGAGCPAVAQADTSLPAIALDHGEAAEGQSETKLLGTQALKYGMKIHSLFNGWLCALIRLRICGLAAAVSCVVAAAVVGVLLPWHRKILVC